MKHLIAFHQSLRNDRYANLFTIFLRILLGVGFTHAGLRKINGDPFAILGQKGAFFEYLDALHATGFYYEFVGWAQILAGVLLVTQRFALLGAFIYFPIILNITVFTLSTIGSLTPVVATFMSIGTLYLLLWDYFKWGNLIAPDHSIIVQAQQHHYPKVSRWWVLTGVIILLIPILIAILIRLFLSVKAAQSFFAVGLMLLPLLLAFFSFIIDEVRFRINKNKALQT